MATKEQITGTLEFIKAIADTIREMGEVPSGHLYAHLMGRLTLEQYTRIIDILKQTGFVEETPGHLLRWVGAKAAPSAMDEKSAPLA